MNSQVVGRKKASAGGLIRPLVTYALLSFLPPAKETTSNLKERDARAQASDPASAAASKAGAAGPGQAVRQGAACNLPMADSLGRLERYSVANLRPNRR